MSRRTLRSYLRRSRRNQRRFRVESLEPRRVLSASTSTHMADAPDALQGAAVLNADADPLQLDLANNALLSSTANNNLGANDDHGDNPATARRRQASRKTRHPMTAQRPSQTHNSVEHGRDA